MSVLHKSMAAGLMALTLTGTTLIPATPANANHDFWGGVAVGAVGGLLLSQGGRPYAYYGYPGPYYRPYYRPYHSSYYRPYYQPYYGGYYRPAYRSYYRPYSRYYYAPRCHIVWRHNGWGDAYRTRVCY